MNQLEEVREQAFRAVAEICEASGIKPGELFVVGCSTSEVLGEKIGTHTSMETAEALYDGVTSALLNYGARLAAQCCEHLNRALVVKREVLRDFHLEQVNAVPHPNHAGGAFASVAYQRMADAVLVESLEAQGTAGIDIGGTLIGMHIHPVVVPLRISLKKIGEADILCARRRPKYVGGERAVYDPSLM